MNRIPNNWLKILNNSSFLPCSNFSPNVTPSQAAGEVFVSLKPPKKIFDFSTHSHLMGDINFKRGWMTHLSFFLSGASYYHEVLLKPTLSKSRDLDHLAFIWHTSGASSDEDLECYRMQLRGSVVEEMFERKISLKITNASPFQMEKILSDIMTDSTVAVVEEPFIDHENLELGLETLGLLNSYQKKLYEAFETLHLLFKMGIGIAPSHYEQFRHYFYKRLKGCSDPTRRDNRCETLLSFLPDALCVGASFVHYYARRGAYGCALDTLERTEALALPINKSTYIFLAEMMGNAGLNDESQKLLQKAGEIKKVKKTKHSSDSGKNKQKILCESTVDDCLQMLNKCRNSNNSTQALKIYKDMKRLNIVPNKEIYFVLLQILLEHQILSEHPNISSASVILEEAFQAGYVRERSLLNFPKISTLLDRIVDVIDAATIMPNTVLGSELLRRGVHIGKAAFCACIWGDNQSKIQSLDDDTLLSLFMLICDSDVFIFEALFVNRGKKTRRNSELVELYNQKKYSELLVTLIKSASRSYKDLIIAVSALRHMKKYEAAKRLLIAMERYVKDNKSLRQIRQELGFVCTDLYAKSKNCDLILSALNYFQQSIDVDDYKKLPFSRSVYGLVFLAYHVSRFHPEMLSNFDLEKYEEYLAYRLEKNIPDSEEKHINSALKYLRHIKRKLGLIL
ncbi:MAG: hypothetical protein ABIE74_05790 [Pseudomonadota bacterium]